LETLLLIKKAMRKNFYEFGPAPIRNGGVLYFLPVSIDALIAESRRKQGVPQCFRDVVRSSTWRSRCQIARLHFKILCRGTIFDMSRRHN